MSPLITGFESGASLYIAPDPANNILCRSPRSEHLTHSGAFKSRDIVGWNNSAGKEYDVVGIFFLQQVADPGQQCIVSSGKNRQTDAVHVLLDGRGNNLFWRLMQTSIDHLETRIPECPGN